MLISPPLTRLVYMLFVDVVVGLVKLLLTKLLPIVVDADDIINGVVGFPAPSFVLKEYLLLLTFTEIKPNSVADKYAWTLPPLPCASNQLKSFAKITNVLYNLPVNVLSPAIPVWVFVLSTKLQMYYIIFL